MTKENQNKNKHQPVLLEPVLRVLDPGPQQRYLDLTAGYGGHASAVLELTRAPQKAVLVDRDSSAIASLHSHLPAADIVHSDYLSASRNLADQGKVFDLILADLGVSSPHLDDASRGFSFAREGPLDMRMDTRSLITAETIVNTWAPEQLTTVLRRYGEEPHTVRIVHAIVEGRPFKTTTGLAEAIARAMGGKYSRIHPATRTFQALRIAVNDELGQLADALPIWERLLARGGRLAVISFHSLEDRLVKQYFRDRAGDRYDAPLQLLTKKPLTASPEEIAINPRARSAKLRAAVKK